MTVELDGDIKKASAMIDKLSKNAPGGKNSSFTKAEIKTQVKKNTKNRV